MKIAVDAMGGDNAPLAVVQGSLQAAEKWPDLDIILVGDPDRIQQCMAESRHNESQPGNIVIEKATEIIGMEEHPAGAVRQKKDSSIVVATRMVREKRADAVVSAGNTGAQMAAALFSLRRIPGIDRPAICTVLPAPSGAKVLLDVGANPDAKGENLYQFALMGSIYAQHILKVQEPRVSLLNIGSEESKGNQMALQAYELLKNSSLNFKGNIEGRELMQDKADVIVCDAFVGNIVLKSLEGLSSYLFSLIREKLTASFSRKIGAALVMPALKEIAHSFDYADYGGAPLLGVNGTSIVCHGSSNAKAIMNAVGAAKDCVCQDVIGKISRLLAEK